MTADELSREIDAVDDQIDQIMETLEALNQQRKRLWEAWDKTRRAEKRQDCTTIKECPCTI